MIAANDGRELPTPSALQHTRLWISAGLEAADHDALFSACDDIRAVNAGTDLLRQRTTTNDLYILLEGWAARYRLMEDGSRHIRALALPGDICNVDALRFDALDYGVMMLTSGTVAVLPRHRADVLLAARPAIGYAFWSLALAENSILAEWSASIGRRSAQQRVAHFLCELLVRLTAIGEADGFAFDLPLTQEQIGDSLGLTGVHVNRTVNSLRLMGLVTVHHRRVTIHGWSELSALCGFRPAYLRLETIDEQFARTIPLTGAYGKTRLERAARPAFNPSATSAPGG
jgi:CRP-like cAMP-binding protein